MTSGAGTAGGVPMRTLTAVQLEKGETVTCAAREATELLHFGLPNLDGLSRPLDLPAQAAE